MEFRKLLALAVMVGALSWTQSGKAETFRWAFQGDVATLDPHSLFETMTLGFQSNIYEGLVTRDPELNLKPSLAVSWENIEAQRWRFELRKGVTFHNGNAFTAEDVAFSAQRIKKEGSDLKVVAKLIDEVEVVDEHTVDIVTPVPNPILPLQLEFFFIMDKEWAEANGTSGPTNVKGGDEDNFANMHSNGTGPFRLVARRPDVRTELERNPDWWGEPPGNVDMAIFTPISQDATRVAALIAGDVDLAYPIPVQDWERLKSAEGVRPLTGPEARTVFLGFDQARDELLYSNVEGKNPFKDVQVRRAFLHAIDIEAIKEKIMRGASVPSGLMVAPQINGWTAKLNERAPYDPEKARNLMAEAGYEDGFEVTLDCPNDRYVNDERICQAVAAMLARIEVDVHVLAQTKSKYFAKVLAQNNYDTSFFLLGWTPSSFDSQDPISALMSCRVEGKGAYNLGGYCNERVTELADLILVETDDKKRQDLIDEAFRIHKEEVGHIPLHQQPLSWGVREGVSVAQRADNLLSLRYVQVGE